MDSATLKSAHILQIESILKPNLSVSGFQEQTET